MCSNCTKLKNRLTRSRTYFQRQNTPKTMCIAEKFFFHDFMYDFMRFAGLNFSLCAPTQFQYNHQWPQRPLSFLPDNVILSFICDFFKINENLLAQSHFCVFNDYCYFFYIFFHPEMTFYVSLCALLKMLRLKWKWKQNTNKTKIQ